MNDLDVVLTWVCSPIWHVDPNELLRGLKIWPIWIGGLQLGLIWLNIEIALTWSTVKKEVRPAQFILLTHIGHCIVVDIPICPHTQTGCAWMQAFKNLLGLVQTRMQNFSSSFSSAWVERHTYLQEWKLIRRHFPPGTWYWKLFKSWEDRLKRAIFQNKTKASKAWNLSINCYIPGLCKSSLIEGRCFLANSMEILNCCEAWNRRDIWTDRLAKASSKFQSQKMTQAIERTVTPKHKQFLLLLKPQSWC